MVKSGARLPKLKAMKDYRHAKPEKPFYSVVYETDTLSPEALAVNKIQKLKSKWKLSDKKSRMKSKRQKKKNVSISMSQSVLLGPVKSRIVTTRK